MREVPAVVEEQFVGHGLPSAQPGRSHSNKGVQHLGEAVPVLLASSSQVVTDVEMTLLPRPVELGYQSMVEQVEKVAQGTVPLVDQQLRVVLRQDAAGSGQTEKRDDHFRNRAIGFAPWRGRRE